MRRAKPLQEATMAVRDVHAGLLRSGIVRWLALAGTFFVTLNVALAQTPEIADEPGSDKPILALDTGGHINAVYKLMVSGYGDQLISVGLDKTIRLWDLNTGEPLHVLRPP